MKNQKEHISIRNEEPFLRNYFLRKEYKELVFEVHQSGGEIWAEFIVELIPTKEYEIIVELIEAATKFTNLRECFIKGITNGVNKFKSYLNNQDIGISGMIIRVTNKSYHPIDSKPSAYSYPFLELMKRLTNTEFFGMEVSQNSNKSIVHNSQIIEFDINKDRYILKENQFQLVSPKLFTNTIRLNNRVVTEIKDVEKNITRWKTTISPKSEYDRRLYSIDIEFRDKFERIRKYKTINYTIKLNRQINHLINQFHIRKINVAGFYLLVEPVYNSEEEPFVNSNFELIKWAIFNSLLDKSISETKEENL